MVNTTKKKILTRFKKLDENIENGYTKYNRFLL